MNDTYLLNKTLLLNNSSNLMNAKPGFLPDIDHLMSYFVLILKLCRFKRQIHILLFYET